jgi:3-dehydroquinate dehydratase/shikimate dehydrogenase
MRDVYRYDSITDATKIYGVVADPVGHSLSPVVHNAALAASGIDAVYLPFRVPAEQLDDFITQADRWPLSGLSVTIPHKETVLKHAVRQDGLVESIGAANTLVFGTYGVEAFNTDATGALESLEAAMVDHHAEANAEGIGLKTAIILGAGGAARAVAFGLRQRGVDVAICSRTFERAHEIAKKVDCKAIKWDARYDKAYDCVINATPIGMHPHVNETPYDESHLRSYMVVFDTVYNPENTLLIKRAGELGCHTVTGVDMFVRQAAVQHRIWHSAEPPLAVMREALKRATSSVRSHD